MHPNSSIARLQQAKTQELDPGVKQVGNPLILDQQVPKLRTLLSSTFEEQRGELMEKQLVKVDYDKLGKSNFAQDQLLYPNRELYIEEDDGWIVAFAHDEDTDLSHACFTYITYNRVGMGVHYK
ncbi:hypothetical protein LguiB_011022 [Lonicera macranthoides]